MYETYLTKAELKRKAHNFFEKKRNGEWIENACDVCKIGGMSKDIYEFQKANRPKGTICSKCSRKEDHKASLQSS